MGSKISDFGRLVSAIKEVHESLVAQAGKAVNISLTLPNWLISAYIAEYELHGDNCAPMETGCLQNSRNAWANSESATAIVGNCIDTCDSTVFILTLWGHCPHNCAKGYPTLCPPCPSQETKKWGHRPHD